MDWRELLRAAWQTRLARVVGHILEDLIITLVLLGSLTLVHLYLEYASASETFKTYFGRTHESVVFISYGNLALKSMIRLWRE